MSRKGQSVVTLMDIAVATELTAKTVSLALRGHPSVSKETAAKVQKKAVELGYTPRREKQKVLGLVVPYIGHIAYGELIASINTLASSYDHLTLVGETTGHPGVERRLIDELIRRGVAGLVLISPRMPSIEINNISRTGLPMVTINTPVGEGTPFSFGSIEVDNEAGASKAVKHLIDQGHERIVYLSGRYASVSDQQRRRGYTRALNDSGLDYNEEMVVELGTQVTTAWPNFQVGYERCQEVFSRELDPDAIFSYNDVIAIGALRALHAKGLKVPDDISVIGFDNLALAQFSNPPLTTVGVDWEKIAWIALNTLFGMISGEKRDPPLKLHHKLTPELIIRESVTYGQSLRSR